jgi:hypothetical protein
MCGAQDTFETCQWPKIPLLLVGTYPALSTHQTHVTCSKL